MLLNSSLPFNIYTVQIGVVMLLGLGFRQYQVPNLGYSYFLYTFRIVVIFLNLKVNSETVSSKKSHFAPPPPPPYIQAALSYSPPLALNKFAAEIPSSKEPIIKKFLSLHSTVLLYVVISALSLRSVRREVKSSPASIVLRWSSVDLPSRFLWVSPEMISSNFMPRLWASGSPLGRNMSPSSTRAACRSPGIVWTVFVQILLLNSTYENDICILLSGPPNNTPFIFLYTSFIWEDKRASLNKRRVNDGSMEVSFQECINAPRQ